MLGLLGLTSLLLGAETGIEFFETRIRPVLAQNCYGCHSAQVAAPLGGFRVDTEAGLRQGGQSGPAIVPGNPSASLLLEAIRWENPRRKMPPGGKLPPEVIADFERWIMMGAPVPRAAEPSNQTARMQNPMFEPLRRPPLPSVRNQAWVRTPVDAFILAALEAKGLSPAPPADKRAWLRRVTYDLTGLPPTPEEVARFLADDSPKAKEKVVERLLASPHYAERWARHWLDLVRFVETNGHEYDNDKLDAWRYRDYVIRAFADDIPYDQFVREHIAGDLLPQPRISKDGAFYESPLGTGFFWFGEVLNSATDSVKSRADTVDNQLDVLGKAFLGLTVACARCHDHKFDPIPTRDYYALAGILHSTYLREAVIDSKEHAARIHVAHQQIRALNDRIRTLIGETPQLTPPKLQLREGDILFEDFEGSSYANWFSSGEAFGKAPSRYVAPNQPLNNYRGEGLANSFGYGANTLVGSLTSRKFKLPKLWVHIRMAGTGAIRQKKTPGYPPLRVTLVADDHKSQHFVADGKPGLVWKTIRMTKEIGRNCYFEIVDRSRDGHIVVDKIVFSDHQEPPPDEAPATDLPPLEERASGLDPKAAAELAELKKQREAIAAALPESAFAMISMDEDPHDVRLHIRGSHQNLGPVVPRGFIHAIAGPKQSPIHEGSGRLQLAEWLSSPDNPLVARVMVNRIWKHHFGHGLVRSVDNFGRLGEPASHPELLDDLAWRFIASGWSIKAMHRLMVLSNTYAMSGRLSEAAAQADPRNTLWHHMPPRRLEAEVIRDALLAVSGKLDPTLYGPGVPPHISKYQDGRGKPESGPLDGDGRRSIYIQLRRNFLPPMFLAFDYPLPVSTIGARGVSTVPSQALLMMNNEFVAGCARAWAQRVISNESAPQRRIEQMFLAAYGRPPEPWEMQECLGFVNRGRQQTAGGEVEVWAALGHVLFNSAEFIYVP